jgi:hypothetical protein
MYKEVACALERKVQQDCLRTKAVSNDKNYHSNVYIEERGAWNETEASERAKQKKRLQ